MEGTIQNMQAEYPAPQPGHVYVVTIPRHYNMTNTVLAVFKNARKLEHFFKGARIAQIRYQGHDRPLAEVRSWYSVIERKVEG